MEKGEKFLESSCKREERVIVYECVFCVVFVEVKIELRK